MKRLLQLWFLTMAFQTALLADTIYVDPGVNSLQSIIDLAKAKDVLWLKKGVHFESNILIRKTIYLTGDQDAVLDGGAKGSIIIVERTNANIYGLQFRNTGYSSMDEYAAIKLLSASRCVIQGNNIENACFGIYMVNASNCVIRRNKINANSISEQRSGNGIHAWQSDSLTIDSNTITGHRDGIYFEFVYKTGVYQNISKNNLRYGIHFMFSNEDEYIGNTFDNNGSGVAVMFSKLVHIRKNIFRSSSGGSAYGILLKEINDSEVEQNLFEMNTNGIFMEGSNRAKIRQNRFFKNGWACRIQANCSDVLLTQNNFSGNSFDISTNGSLQAQNFNGNYWDRYDGYDLDKNGTGDVPFSPVSTFGVIVERMPYAMLLHRSFMVFLLDRSERVLPGLTSEQVKDHKPSIRPHSL